ncbi:hypothetical protein B0H34DRAFT_648979 [Crassisporium funariophilum]|nr:hypothetical protein B0H34DRAFT_648979 [Crassisporium funariophilum]
MLVHAARVPGWSGFIAGVNLETSGPLEARQTAAIPGVPAQCKSDCDPVNTILATGGCPPAQCCLSSFETGYFNCFGCVAQSINFTDFSAPQSVIDTLFVLCAQRGFTLPKLTFPGQNPNRTLSTGAPGPTPSPSLSLSPGGPTTTISDPISLPISPGIPQTTVTSLPSDTNVPPSTQTASAIRITGSGGSGLIAMILGIWFFVV